MSGDLGLPEWPTKLSFKGKLMNPPLPTIQPKKTITQCIPKSVPFPASGSLVLSYMTKDASPWVSWRSTCSHTFLFIDAIA